MSYNDDTFDCDIEVVRSAARGATCDIVVAGGAAVTRKGRVRRKSQGGCRIAISRSVIMLGD